MSGNGKHLGMASAIIGRSPAMRKALGLIQRFAPTGIPMLLVGETGTGKELFAQEIHRLSKRPGPLVDVNCGALPRDLVEGELFGHRRGAFTGAIAEKRGLLVEAHLGTLFLDELLSLAVEAQAKFLRVLETGEVRRLGDTTKQVVDLRIVAAAQDDLVRHVEEGMLRLDLFQRLSGVIVELPPLRDREMDALELARHFLAAVGKRLHEAAVPLLLHHGWPGNVRELEAVIQRAAYLDTAYDVGPVALAEAIDLGFPSPVHSFPENSLGASGRRLLEACRRAGGNAERAASLLGVSRATLYRRLKHHRMSLKQIAGDMRILETG